MFKPKSVQDIKASYEARTSPLKSRSIIPPDSPTPGPMPNNNSPFANKQSIDSVLNQAKANIDKFNDQVKKTFTPAASAPAASTAADTSSGPTPAPVSTQPAASAAAPITLPTSPKSIPAAVPPTPALTPDASASALPSPAAATPTPALAADSPPTIIIPAKSAPVASSPAIASQAPTSSASVPLSGPPTAPSIVAPSPASPADARPSAFTRPSWIGPPRPLTPSMAKHTVTVEHASPGLQPPVYVFTSLSDPQWTAVEMDTKKQANGEYRFYKTFQVDEGEYQYKFRLGPGDWWALDDSKPTVDDGMRNKNNLLVVKPDSPALQAQQSDLPKPQSTNLPKAVAQAEAVPTPAAAPTIDHEKSLFVGAPSRDNPPQSIAMPPVNVAQLGPGTPGAVNPAPGPLLKHETFDPPSSNRGNEYRSDDFGDGEAGEDDDAQTSPLLRHESLCSTSNEQTQAPLLRHESMSIGEHHDDGHFYPPQSPSLNSLGSRCSSDDAVAPEADPNDPSLERFPTDKRAIYDHIRRASSSLPEDQYREDAKEIRRPHNGSHSSKGGSPPRSLPSVAEDEDEEIEKIREEEIETAEKDEDEIDPDEELKRPAVVVNEGRPAEPITPPMTPKEDENATLAEEHHVRRHPGHRRRPKGDEDVVREFKQEKGVLGTLLDMAMHPLSLFAIAGVVLAVAVGYWKLRYD
ncbi:hypothetical protein EJ03DRAFT_352479 [Teratosphaeria nubilosa]|uniref:AMP-activated protein kinase glycogen-binding domain-containing protein n=1 Tax=Teratosphaeria nubilosa TaxID=161662 RepID=A0A6G1L5D0_9PEZI|nr:hypothetical protein EJ03DRAFT_352479 [Teratosphaeria nubilosa]